MPHTQTTPQPPARRHILPPNATALEKSIDTATPAWDWLADAAEPASTTQNPQILGWLAAHWQVAQFAGYFANTQELLDSALPWLRERGSAAAVKRALSWAGYNKVRIDEDGPWLHIDPGRHFDDDDLAHIATLVRASIPAHVHFYRAYHGWNIGILRLDGAYPLDNALLDDDSGVWVNLPGQDPVKGSQAHAHRAVAEAHDAQAIAAMACQLAHQLVWRTDLPLLDAWLLDTPVDTGLQMACVISLPAVAPTYQQPIDLQAGIALGQISQSPERLPSDQCQAAAHQIGHSTAGELFALEGRTWLAALSWDSTYWQTSIKHQTTQTTEEAP